MSPEEPLLGVILAGGRNTRYGAIKALEKIGGERIIDRAHAALAAVTNRSVLIANEPDTYASVGLPMRSDPRPGLGALGGIYAALLWARDTRARGILAVACDMPFLSADLLAHIAGQSGLANVVAPESTSRRGIEPLCASYDVACLPAIERAIERGDTRMIAFHDDVSVLRIPFDVVSRFGDPEVMFMNVNTPEERVRAESTEGARGRAVERSNGREGERANGVGQ